MDFITGFNANTGTVTSINTNKGEIIFTNSIFQGVKIKIIGANACTYKANIVKIDMKNTEIEEICSNAFTFNNNLAEVIFPESLTSIGVNAFCSTSLANINIPSKVSSMTGFAWNQIPCVKAFVVDENNQYFSSQNGYLFNKEKTILIRAPVSITKESDIPNFANLITIGEFALTTTNLKSFTCSSKMNYLTGNCFHATKNIVKVDLSKGRFKEIPTSCFCVSNVIEIILPVSIETISSQAFKSLKNLSNLVLLRRVRYISKTAFDNCPKLKFIIYKGKTDFSNVECFGVSVEPVVIVTKFYPSEFFCNTDVTKIKLEDIQVTCFKQRQIMQKRNYLLVFIVLIHS